MPGEIVSQTVAHPSVWQELGIDSPLKLILWAFLLGGMWYDMRNNLRSLTKQMKRHTDILSILATTLVQLVNEHNHTHDSDIPIPKIPIGEND